ncbi:MAG: phytanoyl-CoA dioxygenase [Gemmatimonadetes bacterium]|jgi:hypothetical protein|nr:phytanoyl-CoA dioxygenase [Gemmatimonadota bacterium]MBT7863957.1 phytanoyl-CoA dioxygenase [Gemmatimonadota bacterium]
MTSATANEARQQLLRDGFCRFEQVLDADLLKRTRQVSDRLLDAASQEHLEEQKSTGSLISVLEDPFFAELIAAPAAREALAALGFPDPKYAAGFVISKPGGSPPLFWHQDWWGWDEECSYTWAQPMQAFLMWYLVDTTTENGCLRVLKGTHRKRHSMHDEVPDAHTAELRAVVDPDHPAYRAQPEEVDVPVNAGDLVIGDSRLLHSAHANKTDQRRTVITLWYYPAWDELSEPIRARLSKDGMEDHWPPEAIERIGSLRPTYDGDAEDANWNRIPGPRLK